MYQDYRFCPNQLYFLCWCYEVHSRLLEECPIKDLLQIGQRYFKIPIEQNEDKYELIKKEW